MPQSIKAGEGGVSMGRRRHLQDYEVGGAADSAGARRQSQCHQPSGATFPSSADPGDCNWPRSPPPLHQGPPLNPHPETERRDPRRPGTTYCSSALAGGSWWRGAWERGKASFCWFPVPPGSLGWNSWLREPLQPPFLHNMMPSVTPHVVKHRRGRPPGHTGACARLGVTRAGAAKRALNACSSPPSGREGTRRLSTQNISKGAPPSGAETYSHLRLLPAIWGGT